MRPEVARLALLGRLPAELDVSEDDLHERETLLEALEGPVSVAEQKLLLPLLGEDDCYGLAWSIVTLVESAPSWPDWDGIRQLPDEWRGQLWDSAVNAGYPAPPS